MRKIYIKYLQLRENLLKTCNKNLQLIGVIIQFLYYVGIEMQRKYQQDIQKEKCPYTGYDRIAQTCY